jgi:hypothetical protein
MQLEKQTPARKLLLQLWRLGQLSEREPYRGFGMLWLGIICGGIVGLLVLFVAGTLLYAYFLYRRSPEKQWCNRVTQMMAAAQRRAAAERQELQRVGVKNEATEKNVRERAFHTFLTSLSVEQLDPYPGIGPATIAKLRDAGYPNLALLQSGPIQVSGLGEKRLGDVKRAVRDLVKQARSRFDAGACREAQELASQLQVLRASATEHGFRAHARLRAAENVVAQLQPLADLARHYSFSEHVQAVAKKEGFPPQLLELALPDLERTIVAADERAKAAYAASNKPTPVGPQVPPAFESARSNPASPVRQAAEPAPAASPVLAAAQAQATAAIPVSLASAPASQDLFRDALHSASPAVPPPAAPSISPQRLAAVEPLTAKIAQPSEAKTKPPAAEPAVIEPPPTKKAEPPEAKTKPQASREEQLELLEIDPSTPLSADLVRRQYNLLSERYASEKFATAGPEFVAMAQSKRDAILTAATALMESLGEKLDVEPSSARPQDLRHNPDLDAMFGD